MSTLIFDYLYIHEMNQWFPCLDCVVEHDKKTIAPAIIDSGSSLKTLIPYSVASDLGLITDNMKQNFGFGPSGKFYTYETTLRALHIVNSKEEHLHTFDDLDVIIPVKNTYNLPFIVLGRDTIFSRYDITFSEKNKKIILSEPDSTKKP